MNFFAKCSPPTTYGEGTTERLIRAAACMNAHFITSTVPTTNPSCAEAKNLLPHPTNPKKTKCASLDFSVGFFPCPDSSDCGSLTMFIRRPSPAIELTCHSPYLFALL